MAQDICGPRLWTEHHKNTAPRTLRINIEPRMEPGHQRVMSPTDPQVLAELQMLVNQQRPVAAASSSSSSSSVPLLMLEPPGGAGGSGGSGGIMGGHGGPVPGISGQLPSYRGPLPLPATPFAAMAHRPEVMQYFQLQMRSCIVYRDAILGPSAVCSMCHF